MWKLTIRTSIRHFIANMGKNIRHVLSWFLCSLLLLISIVPFVLLASYGFYFGVEINEVMNQYAESNLAYSLSMALLLSSTGMIAYFVRENPIQLPKMFFLIPVDRKTRRNYLWQRFFLKLFLMAGGIMLYHRILLGGFFYKKAFPDIPVQFGILLFTVWSLILRTGIFGVNPHSSLEESRSLKEALVNFYWIFFLLLQQLLLGIGYLLHIYEKYPAAWLFWLVILGIDTAIAKYCTPETLNKAASYDQVYARLDTPEN